MFLAWFYGITKRFFKSELKVVQLIRWHAFCRRVCEKTILIGIVLKGLYRLVLIYEFIAAPESPSTTYRHSWNNFVLFIELSFYGFYNFPPKPKYTKISAKDFWSLISTRAKRKKKTGQRQAGTKHLTSMFQRTKKK